MNFKGSPFYAAVDRALKHRGLKVENICRDDAVSRRLLEEYGAIFVAAESVCVPPVCEFAGTEEVLSFQNEAGIQAAIIGSVPVELQPAALAALLSARAEARTFNLEISPRGGSEAARRSFADTLRLWQTRFLPALDYWTAQNRLTPSEAERLRSLAPRAQVEAALELEREGIFFSRDFSKSVLYSVAPPGASQHLSMLAFDVAEFREEAVRRILARYGWFQTVRSDLPHFTFLGLMEEELPGHGLRRIETGGQVFWITDVESNS